MKKKKKFYAVACGRKSGVFSEWSGNDGAQAQVSGYPGAKYKSFPSEEEAKQWLSNGAPLNSNSNKSNQSKTSSSKSSKSAPSGTEDIRQHLDQGKIVMFTDGGCIDNPGPGGYGTVILTNGKRKELSEGFRRTTNNRMELTAVIKGLEALQKSCDVVLFSDSKYVVNGITLGWAKNWRRKGWIKSNKEPAENSDLWARLLDLLDTHSVQFNWVKGHAGNPGNERCDQLATQASADRANHISDEPFESGRTTGIPG